MNSELNSYPRLFMEGVVKRFGATLALDGVTFTVESGEVHAMVGENGAGKSTLMKILSGAIPADSGSMWLDGEPYQPDNPLEGRQAGVAMIYQELSLAHHLSIEENILLGVEPCKRLVLDRGSIRQRAQMAMKQLGLGHLKPTTRVSEISIAEQQLVELARAVAVGCRILVLDEPTSSLTQRDISQLFHLIRSLKKRGYGIVYISHFLEEVKEVSDRYTVLRDGKVVHSGVTDQVTTDGLAELMVGRSIDELYIRSPRTPGEVLLEISDLAGPINLLSASLQLRRGEVLGIAGLVGAGRTEMLRTVFGLETIRKGQLKIGAFIGPASPSVRWAQKTGLLSEDRKNEGLALNLSLAENITMTNLSRLGPFGLIFPSRKNAEAEKWIDLLSIKCINSLQKLNDLSGGNQQKAALARLLYHDVDLFLLDEPTRGIDVGSKAEIYRLIDDLTGGKTAKDHPRKAVLIVSSYLPELLGICDRIAVMCRGKLGPAVPWEDLTEHEIMLQATGSGDFNEA
jgi:ribose transport system ATP-binding protein